jgi:beta-phosphoglucomutase-like phosphatase (HAD superfamily)
MTRTRAIVFDMDGVLIDSEELHAHAKRIAFAHAGNFDVDPALAAKTRRDLMERYCDTETLCCTAHFPSPSTGKIRRRGKGFSCEAAS